MFGGSEVDERVPVYKFNDDGKVQNIRPTIYHRESQAMVDKHGAQGIIGYTVRNQFGDVKPMTFKQHARLKDLFERRFLEIVDYWRVHHVPPEYGMTGYDTECINSGILSLQ